MFETFEPLIRQNCGKIMAFAAVGVVSMTVLAVKIVAVSVSGIVNIF